jgi:hypothetical protein
MFKKEELYYLQLNQDIFSVYFFGQAQVLVWMMRLPQSIPKAGDDVSPLSYDLKASNLAGMK